MCLGSVRSWWAEMGAKASTAANGGHQQGATSTAGGGGGATTGGGQAGPTTTGHSHSAPATTTTTGTRPRNFSSSSSSSEVAIANSVAFNPFRAISGMHGDDGGGGGVGVGGGGGDGGARGSVVVVGDEGLLRGREARSLGAGVGPRQHFGHTWLVADRQRARSLSGMPDAGRAGGAGAGAASASTAANDDHSRNYAMHASNHQQSNHHHMNAAHHPHHNLNIDRLIAMTNGLLLAEPNPGDMRLYDEYSPNPCQPHLHAGDLADLSAMVVTGDEATESLNNHHHHHSLRHHSHRHYPQHPMDLQMPAMAPMYLPQEQPSHHLYPDNPYLQQQQQPQPPQQQSVALTLSGRVYTTTSLPSHIWSLNGKPVSECVCEERESDLEIVEDNVDCCCLSIINRAAAGG